MPTGCPSASATAGTNKSINRIDRYRFGIDASFGRLLIREGFLNGQPAFYKDYCTFLNGGLMGQ
jgi:hypothetical protein